MQGHCILKIKNSFRTKPFILIFKDLAGKGDHEMYLRLGKARDRDVLKYCQRMYLTSSAMSVASLFILAPALAIRCGWKWSRSYRAACIVLKCTKHICIN